MNKINFNSIYHANDNRLVELLKLSNDEQCFRTLTSSEKTRLYTKINVDLQGDSLKQSIALELIAHTISHITDDTLDTRGTFWLTTCIKICSKSSTDHSTRSLAFQVIDQLLKYSINSDIFYKSIVNGQLTKIIESFTHLSPENCPITALQCLETSLQLFPGPCSPSRTQIERRLEQFFDEKQIIIVQHIGRCWNLLQQIRGGSAHGVNIEQAWSQHLEKLLGNLNDQFNYLYAKIHENSNGVLSDTARFSECAPQIDLSAEPVTRILQLSTRIKNLCIYINIALLDPFPVPKSVQPLRIIQIIERCVSVTVQTMAREAVTDNIIIAAILPGIHKNLLDVMQSLITLLQNNLLFYNEDVCRILMKSLKWTSVTNSNETYKPYRSLRSKIYEILTVWCRIAKSGCGLNDFLEDFISEVVYDITPTQVSMQLQSLTGSRKHLSQSARRKLQKVETETTISSRFSKHTTFYEITTDNSMSCFLANAAVLDCLSAVMKAIGYCSTDTIFQKIVTTMLDISSHIIDLLTCKTNINSNSPVDMYVNPICRQRVYEVLYNLYSMGKNNQRLSDTLIFIELLTKASRWDSSSSARDLCNNFIDNIQLSLNPQNDSLFFGKIPLDDSQILTNVTVSNINMNNGIAQTTNNIIHDDVVIAEEKIDGSDNDQLYELCEQTNCSETEDHVVENTTEGGEANNNKNIKITTSHPKTELLKVDGNDTNICAIETIILKSPTMDNQLSNNNEIVSIDIDKDDNQTETLLGSDVSMEPEDQPPLKVAKMSSENVISVSIDLTQENEELVNTILTQTFIAELNENNF